jgi:hypothetical protein
MRDVHLVFLALLGIGLCLVVVQAISSAAYVWVACREARSRERLAEIENRPERKPVLLGFQHQAADADESIEED